MGLRLLNKDLSFPPLYPKVERKLKTAHKDGYDIVGGYKLRNNIDLIPNPGMQENYCCCESNVIFICGEATGGKSFAMHMKPLYGIDKWGFSSVLVSTRLQDSKKGSSIFRDAVWVLGEFGNCEYSTSDYPTFRWEETNASHRLIHSNYNTDNPTERAAFIEYAKKNQNSLQQFDEANDLSEFMFMYWISRNRDSSGMIPQTALSFNPDYTNYTTTILVDAGYVGEDWLFKPEMDGVTRYYYAAGDSVHDFIWGDTPEEVAKVANIEISEKDKKAGITYKEIIKSFTAFASSAAENRALVNATRGQSVGNLHATGKTQRSVVKGGYFGPIEKEDLSVNRQMIHSLWINPINDDENMYATLDVSRSVSDNSDDSPMVIWKGLQIIAIKMLRVDLKTLVSTIQAVLTEYNVPVEHFAFDSGGIGEYLQDFTNGNPIKNNRRPIQEYDQYGNPVELEQYFDLRSQLHGKAEALLKKSEISCVVDKNHVLRYGKKGTTRKLIDILFDEVNVFITTERNKKIYYRSKKEYKTKFKSSPDLMDAIIMRAFFELDARPKKQPRPEINEDVYDGLYQQYNSGWGNERRIIW